LIYLGDILYLFQDLSLIFLPHYLREKARKGGLIIILLFFVLCLDAKYQKSPADQKLPKIHQFKVKNLSHHNPHIFLNV